MQEVATTIKDQIDTQPQGLKGRSFASVFRGDRTPERVEFEIGGNEAWVDLLPVDKDRLAEMEAQGANAGGVALLVAHTVTDFCLWTKAHDKATGEESWQMVKPPPEKGRPKHWLKDFFSGGAEVFPDFWVALVEECTRVNMMDAAGSGN